MSLQAFHASTPSLAAIQQAAYPKSERQKRGLFSNTAPITYHAIQIKNENPLTQKV